MQLDELEQEHEICRMSSPAYIKRLKREGGSVRVWLNGQSLTRWYPTPRPGAIDQAMIDNIDESGV